MRYSFSSSQKFIFYETTLGSLLLIIMFILITGLLNQLLTGFLISLPLLALFIFCYTRFSLILASVEIREEGIYICTKKGKCLRSIAWKDVQKVVVSQHPQDPTNRYLLVSANSELSPIHIHMSGIIWAIFHDRQTISLPCDDTLIEFCTSQANKIGCAVQFTGSGRQCNSTEMQALRKKIDRRYKIALLILLFICAVFFGFALIDT